MTLSKGTALEIFTNPNDLEIFIGRHRGKYGFTISRGPGHDGKLLVDTCGFAENREAAVEQLKVVLESIQQAVTSDLEDPRSIPSQYLNPDGKEIDQSKILNSDLIGRILEEIWRCNVARTYEILATAN